MAAKPSTRRTRHKTVAPPLSAREIRFCQKLVTDDLSRYDAYLAAGFPAKDTRAATDMTIYRLVKRREIREYIRHLQHVAAESAKTTVEELGALLANIARADRRRLFDKSGRMLPPHLWPDDVAACVESIEMADAPKLRAGGRRGQGPRGAKAKSSDSTPPSPVKKVKTASRVVAATKLMEWKKQGAMDAKAADAAGGDGATAGSPNGTAAGLDFLGRLAALLAPLLPQPRPTDGVDGSGEAGTPVDPVPGAASPDVPQSG